jgi:nitrite reductase (NO-forming)
VEPGLETAAGTAGRRCRRPQPRAAGELRPTDVVGAFFVCGLAFLLAGALVGVANALDPWVYGRWLALHLVFVGGISQLILGASQFFAGAFLATDPPSRRLVRCQLAAWNLGAIAIALAIPVGMEAVTLAATVALLAGLGVYAVALARMRSRALASVPWATRWYLAGAVLFSIGIVIGALLATSVRWPYGNVLAAHMALNLGGWFGAAIVGTLHTFLPSLAKTTLPFARLQAPTFFAWILGVGAVATGYAMDLGAVTVGGWCSLSAAALLLAINVAACLRRGARPLSLPAWVVASAQAFLVAGMFLATATAATHGPGDALAGGSRGAIAALLVAGWIGLTVLGSLIHLLAVVVRVRDLPRPMPLPSPRWGVPISVLSVAAILMMALAQLTDSETLLRPASVGLLLAYGLLGAWVIGLAARVLARARPRI